MEPILTREQQLEKALFRGGCLTLQNPGYLHEVRTLIARMAPTKAIVISTHILEEVDAVCTRAMIISLGRVVADATPGELEKRAPSGKLDDVFRELTQPHLTQAGAA